jgi:hypothetical protein
MHCGSAEAMSTKDYVTGLVDIQATNELPQRGRSKVQVGKLPALVDGEDGIVD